MIKAFRLPVFDVELENEESDSDDDDDVEDDENEILAANLSECMVYLPQHDSCFVHTIQLVVKDGFKKAEAINKVLLRHSYVQKSVNASEILEGERRLQAKVATRWNSELKSIRSLMHVPVEKLQLLDCQQLNSYDRLILNDLIEILSRKLQMPHKDKTLFHYSLYTWTTSFSQLTYIEVPVINGC